MIIGLGIGVAASIGITSLVISNNIISILSNQIRVYKLSKYNGKIINKQPMLLMDNCLELKGQIKNPEIEILEPNIKKLENHTGIQNLSGAYYNLKTAKVTRKIKLLSNDIIGNYNSKNNEIKYSVKSALGHEFLHLASSLYDFIKKIEYSGFLQRTEKGSVGYGINEGYTELLNSKIYNKDGKIKSYKTQAKIARILEFFFDDPKDMEALYFNFNLPGLIYQLETYAKREEVIKLILDVDSIHSFSSCYGNPVSIYLSIKTQIKLYNWFSAQTKDPVKLEELRKLVCQNKMASLVLNAQERKRLKLYKNKLFTKKQQVTTFEEPQENTNKSLLLKK
ncbi:MAG: hypothetical protein PHN72_02495 [Bacilli bacterium]|nr:hypothetical protein [Bacilli bacterium]